MSDPWGNDPEIQKMDRADIRAQLSMPPGEYVAPLRAGGHIASMPQPEYVGPLAPYYRKRVERRIRRQARMQKYGPTVGGIALMAAVAVALYWAGVTGLN